MNDAPLIHSVNPLAALSRGRIRETLQHALRRLRPDVPDCDDAPQVTALLDEALQQARVWRMTQANLSAGRRTAVHTCSLLTATPEPVREFLLIPFGEVRVERPLAGGSFTFTPAHAAAAVAWLDQLGRKLAIDYDHQTYGDAPAREDGLRPAAGWIGGLEVRDDGLWAVDVSWTPQAAALLRSGEYRYFSPVIFWADQEMSELVALGPVALTNDPAMHGVQPLAASRPAGAAPVTGTPAPPSAPALPDDEVEAPWAESDADALDATPLRTGDYAALRRALQTAEREALLLRRKLRAQEAETFIERGMREGKIVDATSMDWRADYLRDAEGAELRLTRAPVVRPPGRLTQRPAPDGPRAESRRGGLSATSIDPAAVLPEDLDAYERAVLAGRVRQLGIR